MLLHSFRLNTRSMVIAAEFPKGQPFWSCSHGASLQTCKSLPKPDEQTNRLAGAVKLLWGKNVFKVRLPKQGVNHWDEYGGNRDEYGSNQSA